MAMVEQLERQTGTVQEMERDCSQLRDEMLRASERVELECYRAVAEERKKWEAREGVRCSSSWKCSNYGDEKPSKHEAMSSETTSTITATITASRVTHTLRKRLRRKPPLIQVPPIVVKDPLSWSSMS